MSLKDATYQNDNKELTVAEIVSVIASRQVCLLHLNTLQRLQSMAN